jgi:hypothetical protein
MRDNAAALDDMPVFFSNQATLNGSVKLPIWTARMSLKSSGSASPRFSRHSRSSFFSSPPMMVFASEPPSASLRSTSCSALRPRWREARSLAKVGHSSTALPSRHSRRIGSRCSGVSRIRRDRIAAPLRHDL